jgi:GxxExxY protein
MQQITSRDPRDPETYAIIGAAMEVHRILGARFVEPVYQSALELEFRLRGIPHLREPPLPVYYKGTRLEVSYRADFLCFEAVIVELKSVDHITTKEEGQIINYLAASKIRRGLLLNFGHRSLQYQRFLAPLRSQSASSD